MKKRTNIGGTGGISAKLTVLMTFFLIGAVIGSFFAANISWVGQEYIESYLLGSTPVFGFSGVGRAVFLDALLVIVIFTCALSRLGVFVSPLALGVKGFLISMMVTAFIKAFGLRGFLASFFAVALCGFVSVTAFFLLALQSFELSLRRGAGKKTRLAFIDKAYFITTGVCAVVVLICAVLNTYVTPVLSRAVVHMG